MPPSGGALRAIRKGSAASALRTATIALLVVAVAACCPAPLVPTGGTPTAFAAEVVAVDAGSWIAEGPHGARIRIEGAPPAAPGARVYLSGSVAADGSLVVDRVDPVVIR